MGTCCYCPTCKGGQDYPTIGLYSHEQLKVMAILGFVECSQPDCEEHIHLDEFTRETLLLEAFEREKKAQDVLTKNMIKIRDKVFPRKLQVADVLKASKKANIFEGLTQDVADTLTAQAVNVYQSELHMEKTKPRSYEQILLDLVKKYRESL